jgi:sirohydrochlorin ferrochelatase
MTGVLLVAHGSRHPQARATVEELARAIRRRLPARFVAICALDLEPPTLRAALLQLARRGARQVRVVPLLFAPGHHVRVDLPRQVAAAGIAAGWTPTDREPAFATVAGPLIDSAEGASNELLLDALDARAGRALASVDALVLMAAGSSDEDARAAVSELARSWGDRHGVPAQAAFASGPGPAPAEAVTARRAAGAGQVLAGSLFLAPGLLPLRAEQSASGAGATVSPVLGAAPPLVELVTLRATAAHLDAVLAE